MEMEPVADAAYAICSLNMVTQYKLEAPKSSNRSSQTMKVFTHC